MGGKNGSRSNGAGSNGAGSNGAGHSIGPVAAFEPESADLSRARFIGIDVGAETIKVVELTDLGGRLAWTRRAIIEHHKEPVGRLLPMLEDAGWPGVRAAAVCGRLGRLLELDRVPGKQAQAAGFRYLYGDRPATVVSIGSHGFSVLELRDSGVEVMRENSRCSQGTGNFLRQLVERFDLDIEAASALCADVTDPAPLSGRCPVILKTDMTHLANKGESRARILAGLYDAVCENVQVLIKPRVGPSDVLLIGGVGRAQRIRANFGAFCARNELKMVASEAEDGLFLEALGSAMVARSQNSRVPTLAALIGAPEQATLEHVPALGASLSRVKRMPAQPNVRVGEGEDLILGFDIGSTGSKVVAVSRQSGKIAWSGYLNTNGNPVGAAQALMQKFVSGPLGGLPIAAFGATGSGREIVGSLLATCYGVQRVYVLNEIAAHAEGALHYDPRVDTIFEIGGQDAKYIRLAGGRVVDAAMNEACSAGTGSFIEEQGRKFEGIDDVVQLGQEALASADGVSLGQHCSVFMAEIIDEAVAAGVENRAIIAGIYDSIIQNYLNRVKGSRSVGQYVFCQGMPFAADALAAAVARQTGSEVIIPPDPGTVGALGIALLSARHLAGADAEAIDPARFLAAEVTCKDTFVCNSAKGCGGGGNKCRIDRLKTLVTERRQRFTWGGSCSMWDKGTGKVKLPDLAPNPFREREDLMAEVMAEATRSRGLPTVAMTDEFVLKGSAPFFATFIRELGFDPVLFTGASTKALKRGIETANVPFCAPLQQYHGLVPEMAESNADYLLLPMVRSVPRVDDEPHACVCPMVQGSADIVRWTLPEGINCKVISPTIDMGVGNFHSEEFQASCEQLAVELGLQDERWRAAHRVAATVQSAFDGACLQIGRRALSFAKEQGVVPVVVLGRPYTIYNKVLNSNVPALLREQGALAIPVDCYPVPRDVPVLKEMYWGYGQRNLRAAWQLRRAEGVYSMWCSNYSCGPDSFNLHLYAYLMVGKPFAVIETDGHAGDAGTKTRVEAFLHCVREDQADGDVREGGVQEVAPLPPNDLLKHGRSANLASVKARGERVLIPRMGLAPHVLAAALRGVDVPAEVLDEPDRDSVRIGRRHTSGKECVPMTITLGSLLQRVERGAEGEKFSFFMPTANGPCRFGVYNLLHKIVIERLELQDQISVWSPVDDDYFEDLPGGAAVTMFAGFAALDMIQAALFDVRPVENQPGAAQAIYDRYFAEILQMAEATSARRHSLPAVLIQVADGRLFGLTALLKRAARDFAAVRVDKDMPTVMMVGEIYVRCDPFANDFILDKLEDRGIRVRFAPFTEWIEYTEYANMLEGIGGGIDSHISRLVKKRVLNRCYSAMEKQLDWPERTLAQESVDAADEYIRKELIGEAVLTLGGPLHEWRHGLIDGVISVSPLECMPSKVAEAQFYQVAEREGLASLTVQLNGDPLDPEVLDGFAFEVRNRHRQRKAPAKGAEGRPVSPAAVV